VALLMKRKMGGTGATFLPLPSDDGGESQHRF